MARKQTTIVRCDRNGCKEVAEVLDVNEAAPGWLAVFTEKNFKYVGRNEAKEFCSEKCLGTWARDRAKFQKENELSLNGHSEEERHEQKIDLPPKDQKKNGIPLHGKTEESREEIRRQILGALEIDPVNFHTAQELADVTDISYSSVRKYLDQYVEEGIVQIEESLSVRNTPKRMYRLA